MAGGSDGFCWLACIPGTTASLAACGHAILALALPYAGFMDVAGRNAHNNTMVCGVAILSWLWLAATWGVRKPLLLQARSTVLRVL